ncbi:MAG: helix-turn-helix domain-containing protein [Candidatus Korobacteraceae bacterium]|jgi:helix-turn-helix protein
MPVYSPPPYPSREKVFRRVLGSPLGQKAKKAIIRSVELYNVKNRKPGEHHGPITPAFQRVLIAMLWKFHNSRTGYCFPSYETIAASAKCCRDTVYEAIKALEAADILTWVNRFDKIRTQCVGAFGRAFTRWQVIRTSNAYCFRDPLPCATEYGSYKSENPPGTLNQELSYIKDSMKIVVLDPANSLESALIGLGRACGAIPAASAA